MAQFSERFVRRGLEIAESHLPYLFGDLCSLRYRRDYQSYKNLQRDAFLDLAVMDLAALGGLLEFDGHRMPAEFWLTIMTLADHCGLAKNVAELRSRGGYAYHHRDHGDG